jgi:NADH-quinone oxidoreductase subunit J
MLLHASILQWMIGVLLILSAMGVILLRKPIYACLSFLLSLVLIASLYLHLSAEFIAVMQILVYAGAILVIFVFVIVLFQDAHQQMVRFQPKSKPHLLLLAAMTFIFTFAFFGAHIIPFASFGQNLPNGFGSVEGLGRAIYLEFFFPFEAIIMLFLTAIVGALYVAKRER